jgi:hypothetical protein
MPIKNLLFNYLNPNLFVFDNFNSREKNPALPFTIPKLTG